MDLKQYIGIKSASNKYEITEKWLGDFSSSVGRPYSSKTAPPTFMTVCRTGEFELFQKMGVPLSRVLHAEQEYLFENPITAGGEIEFVTELAQVLSKKNTTGAMHFMIFETIVSFTQGGKTVKAGSARSTMVMRE